MKSTYKLLRNQISFMTGLNPRIAKTAPDYRQFIPEPYESVLMISADFELAWAWRFAKENKDKREDYVIEIAERERKNVPIILSLCEVFNIPITWATVGHLFLGSCKRENKITHKEINRIPHFENEWWSFKNGDWFEDDPCSNLKDAPAWYCPDLVREIISSKIGHEIACHTFSHIPCNDSLCSPEIIQSELLASAKAANKLGISLESFVFPGHTMGNYKTIREMGYTSVRTNYSNFLGYPEIDEKGLWKYAATMEITHKTGYPAWYNLYRLKKIINLAIKKQLVCNLWFHPSLPELTVNKLFVELFEYLDSKRDKIWITTMKEYTGWLNNDSRIIEAQKD